MSYDIKYNGYYIEYNVIIFCLSSTVGWVPGPLACVFTLICVVIPFYCARRNGGNHIQANQ